MIITDLEHLELVTKGNQVNGGEFPIDPRILIGKSVSNFAFNSLSVGQFGSFAGGVPEILTTAVPGNFSVGFKFSYAAVAIGIPIEMISNGGLWLHYSEKRK